MTSKLARHAQVSLALAMAIATSSPAAAADVATTASSSSTSAPANMNLPPVLMPGEEFRFYGDFKDVRVAAHFTTGTAWKPSLPVRILVFALPNGNTIEHSFGRAEAPGLDWHYYIQHIGAQTRRLRELFPGQSIVTVYLEAAGKSWPSWRKAHADGGKTIVEILERMRAEFGPNAEIELSAHSGGGSLVTGFLNAVEEIPSWMRRISYLDANYSFEAGEGHGTKLLKWLQGDKTRFLSVIGYDDRNITLNGKPVVSATGGTCRATQRMAADLGSSISLSEAHYKDFTTTSGLEGQLDLRVHANPENKILHTVLVEKNGFVFVHARTGTAQPGGEDFYADPPPYRKWIR